MSARSRSRAPIFVVIAYDIKDDRRRARLHKKLKGFGTPVQFSVFECILTPKNLEKLKKLVKREIKQDEDLVRYYPLCEACRRRIQAIGGEVTQEEHTMVI